MASEGASGADRSEAAGQEFGGRRGRQGDVGQGPRCRFSRRSETRTPPPRRPAAERAASQDRMAATGTVARDAVFRPTSRHGNPPLRRPPRPVEAQPRESPMPPRFPGVDLLAQASPAVPATPALPGAMELGRGLRAMTPAGAVPSPARPWCCTREHSPKWRPSTAKNRIGGRTLGLDMSHGRRESSAANALWPAKEDE